MKEIILEFLEWMPNGIDDLFELMDAPKEVVEKYVKEQDEKLNLTDVEVYGTCESQQGEIYALFDDRERCEIEAEECGCEVKVLTLYKGKRS